LAENNPFVCCRMRAGPLVKECRSLRPRLCQDDTDQERKAKNDLKRCAVCRRATDRLEMYLAILGWEGNMYTLTFDDDNLPRSYKDVQRAWRSFMRKVRSIRCNKPLDVICVPEGLHGEARYHIHMCCRDSDLNAAAVRKLWTNGDVDDEPIIMDRNMFRRIAEYLTKERNDGEVFPVGRHPYTVSRSLSAKLQQPERWRDDSLVISPPQNAVAIHESQHVNDFGSYYYKTWIETDDSPYCYRACVRARVCTRPYLKYSGY